MRWSLSIASVARIERNEIRATLIPWRCYAPDVASLHPGYAAEFTRFRSAAQSLRKWKCSLATVSLRG